MVHVLKEFFSFFNNDVLGSENSKICLMVADGSSLWNTNFVLGFANFVRNKMPLPSKIMGDSSVDLWRMLITVSLCQRPEFVYSRGLSSKHKAKRFSQ